jgi:hypothetical protein
MPNSDSAAARMARSSEAEAGDMSEVGDGDSLRGLDGRDSVTQLTVPQAVGR